MKPFVFLAALLCAAFSTRAQSLQADMTALANAWKAAYERGDAAALAALYAGQVEFVNAQDGSIVTRTRAEVEANFRKTFESQTGTIEFVPGNTSALLPDGKASLEGEFTQTTTSRSTGEKKVFHGIYAHQAVQEGGQWKLCLMKTVPKG
ncbi:MAG: DUF4440 domain-containing protein [Bacteroidia bacterium]|nr:DUF4440 domain-containing protein [Bacteroidia bacterium]